MLLVALATLGGCRLGGDRNDAQVRVIDAVSGSSAARLAVRGRSGDYRAEFLKSTGYHHVRPGTYRVYATVERGAFENVHLLPRDVSLSPRERATMVVLGDALSKPAARLAAYPDNNTGQSPPGSGQVWVRVLNASPDAGRLDILVNSIVAFKDLGFGHRSEPLNLASLPYEWSVKPAGLAATPIAGPFTLKLGGRHSYLVVVAGRMADRSVTLKAFVD